MANSSLEASIDAEMQQAGNSASAQDPVAASIDEEMNQAKYGTPGQEALTALEGAAKGAAGPLATGAERLLSKAGVPGLSPEEQAGREQANPWIHGGSELAGFVGPAVLSAGASAAARAGVAGADVLSAGAKALEGYSQAGLLTKAGEAAVPIGKALGIGGPGAGALGKIGSAAVRGAVENGLYQSGDEVSRFINDPNSIQAALPHVGLATLIGGGLGGAAGSVSTLWRATVGPKAGAILHSIAGRVGGIEGVEANPVHEAISKTAMEIPPELQSAASNDPVLREWASTLNQTDTSNSGREFQQTLGDFRQKSGETLAETLGRTPDQIPEDFDKYISGNRIGNALADEVSERVGPLKSAYEGFADKYSGKELIPSVESKLEESRGAIQKAADEVSALRRAAQEAELEKFANPQAAAEAAQQLTHGEAALDALRGAARAPGTTDLLSDKLGQLAQDEKWNLSPSSDIMREVARIQKELPNLKTLDDLSSYIKRVGENMQSDPLNGALMRAGGKIKSLLRDAEGDLIGAHVGSEEGAESLSHYRATQTAYGLESKIKDELAARLGKLGSTSGYADRIREMAKTDGESLFRKLSGKDDADLLRLLQEHFPKTSQALREAHVDQVLSKAKSGDVIDPHKILKGLNGLSPQLRSFVTPFESSTRIDAIESVLNRLKDTHYNYSGTGRTIDKLLQYIPGSAVGLVSMLFGHNPAIAFGLGALTKYVSKDAPDAVRLGLLKWMGSNKPIEAGAFKSMVDVIHATMKGDDLMSKSARALISGASKVIPEHLLPNDSDLSNLDKKLRHVQASPESLEKVGAHPGYYLPNHGISMTATASSAAAYLNQIRPGSSRAAPLDDPIEPTPVQREQFNRALEIAEQPLVVLHSLKEGQLTSQDVTHLKSLYPSLYSRMSQKVMEELVNQTARGEKIPYPLRLGISTLLGQPMDSSLLPQQIMSNQAAFGQANQQEAAQHAPSKSSTSQVGLRNAKWSSRLSLHRDDGASS